MHHRSSYDEPYYYVSDQHLRNTARRRAIEQARLGQPARQSTLLASVRRATANALIGMGKRIEPRNLALPELAIRQEATSD